MVKISWFQILLKWDDLGIPLFLGNTQINVLFSPRNLGKMKPIWRAYFFNWVVETTNPTSRVLEIRAGLNCLFPQEFRSKKAQEKSCSWNNQGSFNFSLFWGGSNLMHTYWNFEIIPYNRRIDIYRRIEKHWCLWDIYFKRYTPQKSNIDTKNCHFERVPLPFPRPIIFGIQPLVFWSVLDHFLQAFYCNFGSLTFSQLCFVGRKGGPRIRIVIQ